jgi:transposase/FtsZ-binding cell division protein ZapB
MNATLLSPANETAAWSSQEGLFEQMASMRQAVEALQREVAELRCEAGYWKSRHADAVRRIEHLKDELEETRAENRKLQDRLFGRKSEKKSKDRSNDLEDSTEKGKRKRGGQKGGSGHGRRDYSHLPEEEEFVEIAPDERICSRCGKPFVEMSDTEDSEQLEIEIRVYRQKTRRKRYRSTCQCCGCTQTVTAPCPAKLIRKSRLGTSLWAHILLDKFASHRPTARLLEELKQHGLNLAPGTVTDGLRRLEPMFTPVYEALFGLQSHAASQSGHDQAGLLLGTRSTRFHRGRQGLAEFERLGHRVDSSHPSTLPTQSSAFETSGRFGRFPAR